MATMMLAQRFIGLGNIRDRTTITTGITINIVIPNHKPRAPKPKRKNCSNEIVYLKNTKRKRKIKDIVSCRTQ
jgi:hypothetical protein